MPMILNGFVLQLKRGFDSVILWLIYMEKGMLVFPVIYWFFPPANNILSMEFYRRIPVGSKEQKNFLWPKNP